MRIGLIPTCAEFICSRHIQENFDWKGYYDIARGKYGNMQLALKNPTTAEVFVQHYSNNEWVAYNSREDLKNNSCGKIFQIDNVDMQTQLYQLLTVLLADNPKQIEFHSSDVSLQQVVSALEEMAKSTTTNILSIVDFFTSGGIISIGTQTITKDIFNNSFDI